MRAAVGGLLLALTAATATGLPLQPAHGATPAPPPPAEAAPAVLSLTVSARRVPVGTAVTLAVRLRRAADAAPLAGQAVEVWAVPTGSPRRVRVATVTTDATGRATTEHSPARHAVLSATSAASPSTPASTSAPQRVEVTRVVRAQLSAPAVPARTAATVTGTVAPAERGRPVTLWLRSGGAWRARATTATAPSGAFRFAVTPTSPGWWHYRVSTPDGAGLAAGEHVLPALDAYRRHTYVVARRGAVSDLRAFAAGVAATYADPRGWRAAHRRFERVASGGELTVVLSEPRHLPSFSPVCSPLYSCRVGRYVVINDARWRSGSRPFPGPLAQYRAMVVNHETGHWLGLGHAGCPRRGAPAPVMQQQSKGLQGCAPNAWPLPHEVTAATPRS